MAKHETMMFARFSKAAMQIDPISHRAVSFSTELLAFIGQEA